MEILEAKLTTKGIENLQTATNFTPEIFLHFKDG